VTRKAAETKRAADARAAEEAKKTAQAKRVADAKAAEVTRKAAETKRAADAKAADEARKVADAKKVTSGDKTSATDDRQPRAARAACSNAGVKVSGAGWYVAEVGDTLWGIARTHYGSGRAYPRIYAANRRSMGSPHLIYPCQRIYIPRRG
jgi:nucleoid-associated protein YgaU